MAEIEASVHDPSGYFQSVGKNCQFFKTEKDVTPLFAAYDALQRRRVLGSIDWRATPEELREELDPLLKKAGIDDFDWSFAEDESCEELQTQELLELVGQKLAKRGRILLALGMEWDAFDFAVVKPADFAKIDGMKGENFLISRQFS